MYTTPTGFQLVPSAGSVACTPATAIKRNERIVSFFSVSVPEKLGVAQEDPPSLRSMSAPVDPWMASSLTLVCSNSRSRSLPVANVHIGAVDTSIADSMKWIRLVPAASVKSSSPS